MNYRVFIRNLYKQTPQGLRGDPSARKTTYCYASTYEEAREICQQYNATHNPGKLSRKAEFEKY
jgi:hypothetical protein